MQPHSQLANGQPVPQEVKNANFLPTAHALKFFMPKIIPGAPWSYPLKFEHNCTVHSRVMNEQTLTDKQIKYAHFGLVKSLSHFL